MRVRWLLRRLAPAPCPVVPRNNRNCGHHHREALRRRNSLYLRGVGDCHPFDCAQGRPPRNDKVHKIKCYALLVLWWKLTSLALSEMPILMPNCESWANPLLLVLGQVYPQQGVLFPFSSPTHVYPGHYGLGACTRSVLFWYSTFSLCMLFFSFYRPLHCLSLRWHGAELTSAVWCCGYLLYIKNL